MGISLDLNYTGAKGKKKRYLNVEIKGNSMLEIALNKDRPERSENMLIPIAAPGIEEEILLATIVITGDYSLGIRSHLECREDVQVVYEFKDGQEVFALERNKIFHLSESLRRIDELEFQERILYFSRVELSYRGQALGTLTARVKEYTLDEELYYDRMLDDYRIIERLSGGPHALYTVFRARHKRIDGIDLAIKMPTPYAIGRQDRYRKILRRLPEIMDALKHPYLPPIVQIGEKKIGSERSVAFVAMKYISGETLGNALKSEKIAQRPFTLREILENMKKLCDVLCCLHEYGVVHRGVASDNLIVDRDSESLCLVGLGYSKSFMDLCDLDEGQNFSLPQTSLIGRMNSKTLDYMPPEFFLCPEKFDFRGDVYSFGAVFYKILFTFGPYVFPILQKGLAKDKRFDVYCDFYRDSIPAPGVMKTISSIEEALVEDTFPGKSKFLRARWTHLKSMDEKLLRQVAKLVDDCLKLDPGQRCQSMEEARHRLELIIAQCDLSSASQTGVEKQEAQADVLRIHREFKREQKEREAKREQGFVRRIKERVAAAEELRQNLATEKERRKAAEAQVQRLETRIGQIEHNQSRLSELQLGLEEKLAETEIDADALEIDYRLMQELLDANLKDVKDLRNERQEYIEKIASLRDCLGILQGREIFSAQKADFSELKDLGKRLEEELAQNHRPKLPGSNGIFYTVEKKAGAGRMGSVFQATRSSDGTLVVVKVITDPTLESLLRFTRENHIILNLEHDCIMKGIDCVQQRYLIYSVAEFVEGQNLSDYIADHTRAHSHSIASSVVLDVAGGLEYLAGKEIVHRDIKPDNIMITSEGKAKIIDFGIATHPDFEATLAPDFLMGAPNYMAPERFVDQCDTRSDIYALGVIYYRMTTGKLPYTAPSLGQLMKKIAKGKFISPRKLNPEISQAEDSLISKMIQRKAIQRFQSPAELLNALENLQKENNS